MKLNLNRPIAFFDLETTGVNVGKDRIVEISIIKVYDDEREEVYNQRINPLMPIPEESSEIHGIYDIDIADSPVFMQKAKEIAAFIGDSDLSGYNCLRFDIPLLMEEFFRAGVEFNLEGRNMIDVQNIFHKMEQRTLSAAYKFYCKKDLVNAHSAEADTRATFEILKAQLDRYQEIEYTDKAGDISQPVVNDMEGLHAFSKVNRNVDLNGHIILNNRDQEVFNFGKHKGKPVEQVFFEEPQYYSWMMKSEFPQYTKKVITEIKKRGM